MSTEPHGQIGSYELVEYLTAGGMADLYLARSPQQDAPLVLKTIQRKYAELTRVVKMFIDEGRIAKALDHPNIVRIYDVGAAQGAYYIAMEFIIGRDLLAIARRGIEAGRFLPLHLACAILAQVTTGLVYAHEKHDEDGLPLNIVHCDISPGNVVVSFGGTAKIVDFGIARAAIQLRAEDHTVAGKYNYMAPEQIRGEPLDARADLFSLGIILYELTVGRRLFRGPAEDVKARITGGNIPRPADVRPDFPPELERIILRALEVDRDRRYGSARELRTDLKAFILADGHPAGKRELAEYLRSLFVTSRADAAAPVTFAQPPDPSDDDTEIARGLTGFAAAPAEGEGTDEELSLEAPIPGLAELVVDADDPEPAPLLSPAPTFVDASEHEATTQMAMPPLRPQDTNDTSDDPTEVPKKERDVPTTLDMPAFAPVAVGTESITSKTPPRRRKTDYAPGKSPFATPQTKAPVKGRRHTDPEGPLHLTRSYPPPSRSELYYAAIAIGIAIVLYLAIRA